jgi:hypothetical protein
LVSKGVPVAAELYSIYEGKDGFLSTSHNCISSARSRHEG